MKQLDNVELFVCSEDATSAIGFADKAEVWTEGGGATIILRGINGVDKDTVLQAENECLRRDVEFYKKLWQARGGTTAPVEHQPEADERGFIEAKKRQMTEYTAADFANARFAEHESGQAVAIRWTQDYAREPDGFWTYERPLNNKFSKEATHQEMADMDGWVPVPTKPQITESQMVKVYGAAVEEMAVFQYALESVGIEVIPDPEPTNAEKLEQLYSNWSQSNLNPPFGEWADSVGVKAPGGDDA